MGKSWQMKHMKRLQNKKKSKKRKKKREKRKKKKEKSKEKGEGPIGEGDVTVSGHSQVKKFIFQSLFISANNVGRYTD